MYVSCHLIICKQISVTNPISLLYIIKFLGPEIGVQKSCSKLIVHKKIYITQGKNTSQTFAQMPKVAICFENPNRNKDQYVFLWSPFGLVKSENTGKFVTLHALTHIPWYWPLGSKLGLVDIFSLPVRENF